MFGPSYFGNSYFGGSWFGPSPADSGGGGGENPSDPGAIWSNVNVSTTTWTTVS